MSLLALCNQVRDRKENNDREGTDQQHVPYIVASHCRARFGGVFRNTAIFDLRHILLRAMRLVRVNAGREWLFRSLSREDANVERAESVPVERYAVKIIFLGIFTHCRQTIWKL